MLIEISRVKGEAGDIFSCIGPGCLPESLSVLIPTSAPCENMYFLEPLPRNIIMQQKGLFIFIKKYLTVVLI